MSQEPFEIEVGGMMRDNDKRSGGRIVEILRIAKGAGNERYAVYRFPGKRLNRVNVERIHPPGTTGKQNGWTYIGK